MNRFVLIIASLITVFSGNAQDSQVEDTTIARTQELQEVRYIKNFDAQYAQKFRLIKRTYPLAVRAAEVIDSLEMDLADESKKRKRKKITKNRKKELEEELEFLIKDLYMSEGRMLFKLIHRQTGMTVTEILSKYRGNFYAKTVRATFSLYGHDTDGTFDADGDDWVTELVVQDIEAGRKKIDMNIKGMSKSEYKQNLKEYRERRKEQRKNGRKSRKAKKKAARKGSE